MVPCQENSHRIPAQKFQEDFHLANSPYLIQVTYCSNVKRVAKDFLKSPLRN